MNKTRRRAVQKHRAKDKKFSERRKAEQEMLSGAKARAQIQPSQATPRSRAASRPQPDAPEPPTPDAEAAVQPESTT